MIPDLPHNVRIKLARLIFLLRPDIAFSKLRQATGQKLSNIRTQQKISIRPILFFYYEESLETIIKIEFKTI